MPFKESPLLEVVRRNIKGTNDYSVSLSLSEAVSLPIKRGVIITLTTPTHGVCYVDASAI